MLCPPVGGQVTIGLFQYEAANLHLQAADIDPITGGYGKPRRQRLIHDHTPAAVGEFSQALELEIGLQAQAAVKRVARVHALQLDAHEIAARGTQHGIELGHQGNPAVGLHPGQRLGWQRSLGIDLDIAPQQHARIRQQGRADLAVEAAAGRHQGNAEHQAGAEHPQRASARA